jgi:hypothetical protein
VHLGRARVRRPDPGAESAQDRRDPVVHVDHRRPQEVRGLHQPLLPDPGAPGHEGRHAVSDSLDELKGKKIGVQRGSIHDRFAKEVLAPKGATVVPYGSQNEIYLDVAAGRLDGTVADATLLQDGFLEHDCRQRLRVRRPAFTDVKYFGDGIGIAVRKGDKETWTASTRPSLRSVPTASTKKSRKVLQLRHLRPRAK